jgi:hypothetical protein
MDESVVSVEVELAVEHVEHVAAPMPPLLSELAIQQMEENEI